MAVREILKIGHPDLRLVALPVDERALAGGQHRALIDDLVETMHAASGAGLAAPQIGVRLRVAVMRVSSSPRYPELEEFPLTVFINPEIEILPTGGVVHFFEGCLSVPGLRGRVSRPSDIRVSALDAAGQRIDREFHGPLASVVQHELDHLDGVLFVDRAERDTMCSRAVFERVVPRHERIVVHPGERSVDCAE